MPPSFEVVCCAAGDNWDTGVGNWTQAHWNRAQCAFSLSAEAPRGMCAPDSRLIPIPNWHYLYLSYTLHGLFLQMVHD